MTSHSKNGKIKKISGSNYDCPHCPRCLDCCHSKTGEMITLSNCREFNRKRHMELHVLFKHSQGDFGFWLQITTHLFCVRAAIQLWTVWKEVQNEALRQHPPQITRHWRLQLVLWRVWKDLQSNLGLSRSPQSPLKHKRICLRGLWNDLQVEAFTEEAPVGSQGRIRSHMWLLWKEVQGKLNRISWWNI